MSGRTHRLAEACLAACLLLATAACATPAAAPGPEATAVPAPPVATPPSPATAAAGKVAVGPATTGWPRTVKALNGTVTIPAKPMRIHTLSVGHDEITFRLVDPSRIIAVGTATVNPLYSNVAAEAARIPNQVGREAEQILALQPDLVVGYPFASKDLQSRLEEAGVTLVVTDQGNGIDGFADTIRFLAYLYGEEQRGEELIQETQQRLARIDRVVQSHAAEPRPRVLVLSPRNSTWGAGTNVDEIISRAGGINVATEAGVQGPREISQEAVPRMAPDVIVLSEQDPEHPQVEQEMLANPAILELPAIRHHRYFRVRQAYLTTLSYWNVRGMEELARILYPRDF